MTFRYSATAPPARVIFHQWFDEYRFLPFESSEPERTAQLIQRVLWRQRNLLVPNCPHHETRMVLLGKRGRMRVNSIHRLTMAEALRSTKDGFVVACGIFRCPVPGCFRVDGTNGDRYYPPA